MTRLLAFFLLLLVSFAARADYAPRIVYYDNSASAPEPATLCNARKASSSSWASASITSVGYPTVHFAVCKLTTTSGVSIDINMEWRAFCDNGGALNSNDTMCIGGTPPVNCEPGPGPNVQIVTAYYTGPQEGAAIAKRIVPDGGARGMPTCMGGCALNTVAVLRCTSETTPSKFEKYSCTFSTEKSGATCTGNGPDQDPPTADGNTGSGKCPVGQSPSGQDSSGHTKCSADKPPTTTPPKVTESKPPVTTTNPDGGSTTKTESSESNSDGSTTTTTKTTTTKPDGTSTTTVTLQTKKPDGTAGGAPDKPDSDLCKQNPNLSVCKNSQVMGTCEAVTCEGDAIQCATLRAAATLQCRQKEDIDQLKASPLSTLGTAVLAGNDPMKAQIDTVMKGDTVDFSNKATMDEAAFLPSSCFGGSKTFAVAGRTITVNFASACAGIEPLKYVILAIAYIVAVLLVNKAVLQG